MHDYGQYSHNFETDRVPVPLPLSPIFSFMMRCIPCHLKCQQATAIVNLYVLSYKFQNVFQTHARFNLPINLVYSGNHLFMTMLHVETMVIGKIGI